MIDLNKLFDDAVHSTTPPSEEQPRVVPQIRLTPAKQGPANDRLLAIEVGHVGGFARQREHARLEEIRRNEALAEAKDRQRMADAKAAAVQRRAESEARKQREKALSELRREKWCKEDGE